MKDEKVIRAAIDAIQTARRAWHEANRDLPSNTMTRTAAIPATGILAAAILDQPEEDHATLAARAHEAISIARRAWELTHGDPPGNPIAAMAERSVIGIIAAGVFRYLHRLEDGAGS
jgi:hypothetical protein